MTLVRTTPEPEFTFYIDKRVQFRWQIKSKNGRIVGSSSQGFDSKQSSLRNFNLLREMMQTWHDAEKGKPD